MLSEKVQEFGRYLSDDREKILPNFGKHLQFTGKKGQEASSNSNINYFLLGIATLASIVGLGYLSLKNLSKSKNSGTTSLMLSAIYT